MRKVVIHLINSKIFSGLENVACDIIENTKDEFDCIYVTQDGPIVDVLKEKNISYEIINKMSVNELKRVIKKYNVDIIHAHDYTASVISALSFVSVPIISHLHNNSPWIKTFHPFSFLFLFCSFRFKKILTVSESIENEYVFSKFIKNKIVCISNPVSTTKILCKVNDNDFRKKYDICCIGRLTLQKNPYKFLDVINKVKDVFPNVSVIWLGDGELKERVEDKIKDLKLENNVKLLGFKKNPYSYLASSKLFLLTSDWEGYGLVAFEALTLGVPAIVSNVGGLPNIVDSECGLLCFEVEEYSAEIIKLLTSLSYYESKSKSALSKSKQLDNSSTYYRLIKKLYFKLKEDFDE